MNAGRVKLAAAAVAVLGVGYVAWRAYRGGAGIVEAAQQRIEQAAADVTSTWNNYVAQPFMEGRRYAETGETRQKTIKEVLFGGVEYDGIDAQTGMPVIAGEWYGDAEARRYTYEQLEKGAAPAASSINGAAFGMYPSASGSYAISTRAAEEARRRFAATDPRRLDL